MLYRIQAGAIDTTYEGSSESEVLDNYAKDAGYKSYADVVEQFGEVDSVEPLSDAEIVKRARRSLGLNQTQFAEKVGFTDQAYVSKIERGERNLSRSSRKFIESLA